MKTLIQLYQALDAAKHQLLFTIFGFSSVCKHRPTCSQYTLQEMETNGTIVGLWRGFLRFLTCY